MYGRTPEFPQLSHCGQAETSQVVVRKQEIERKSYTDNQTERDYCASDNRRVQAENDAPGEDARPRECHDSIDADEDWGVPNRLGSIFLCVVIREGIQAEDRRTKAARNKHT